MTSTEKEPDDGNTSDVLPAVVQVLRPDGGVAGAGFLVSDRVVVTCAHVVEAAGGRPGAAVQVAFPHVRGVGQVQGQVSGELWRATQDEDVAFIRLSSMPAGARVLPLGSAEGCRGHQVRSFGFPAQAPPEGHFGFGVAGDLLPGSRSRSAHLQLTAANDLTTGFSGGPVLDEVTGLVIGMLTEIAAPDEFERGQGVAYVTPTQVLRGILPELVEREVCPYRGLAYHEAGHTVLGQLAGFTCERTRIHTITRDGVTGWTGATTWARSFGTFLDIAVVCGASGQAADLHQLAESGRLTPETARLAVADHDKQMALSILKAEGVQVTETGPAPDGGLAWDHVMATAQQDVDREWDRIAAVAEALLAAPAFTLTGAQAAQIAGIPTA